MRGFGVDAGFIGGLGGGVTHGAEAGGRDGCRAGGGGDDEAVGGALDAGDVGFLDVNLLAHLGFGGEDERFVELDARNFIEGDGQVAGIGGLDGELAAGELGHGAGEVIAILEGDGVGDGRQSGGGECAKEGKAQSEGAAVAKQDSVEQGNAHEIEFMRLAFTVNSICSKYRPGT